MTQGKHTPGPWSANTVSADDASIGVSALGNRLIVASVHNGASAAEVIHGQQPKTQWANARLIAAAPEMLQALEWIAEADDKANPMRLADVHRVDCRCWRCAADNARAAIAKAEGAQ